MIVAPPQRNLSKYTKEAPVAEEKAEWGVLAQEGTRRWACHLESCSSRLLNTIPGLVSQH